MSCIQNCPMEAIEYKTPQKEEKGTAYRDCIFGDAQPDPFFCGNRQRR